MRVDSVAALLLLGLSTGFSPSALAKDRVLFQPNREPVQGYNALVAAIARGDRLIFSGGTVVEIEQKISCGSTTCIFEIAEPLYWRGKVLRIPASDKVRDRYPIQDYIGFFIGGEKALKDAGIPSVNIYASRPGQFVIAERVESEIRLDQLLQHPQSVPEARREKLIADLRAFAAKTFNFEKFGDFRGDQLHYVEGRGWMLLDWDESHVRSDGEGPKTVFDQTFQIGIDYHENMNHPDQALWVRSVRDSVQEAVWKARGVQPKVPGPTCPGRFGTLGG